MQNMMTMDFDGIEVGVDTQNMIDEIGDVEYDDNGSRGKECSGIKVKAQNMVAWKQRRRI